MKNRQLLFSILAVGMALGTAWAVRGKFGHEQGAAWAGAIGALALILVAKRRDWYPKTFQIIMAAAFGWGLSGMMSYGILVGYGRGTDFVNVFYGLLMLFVLGVLYGFLGGGFFGLALADSKASKVKWASLLAEMVALALLTYGLLVNQLGWFMNPPRSELWAACLGASVALAWYLVRHQHSNVMKVAVWSAIGAGLGFALGNFLQVIGGAFALKFINLWNVMEYSIGFCGGVGMAYGTFTSQWPVYDEQPSRGRELAGIFFVTLFVPFVVWEQSFVTDRFDFIPPGDGTSAMIPLFKLMAIAGILIVAVLALRHHYMAKETGDRYPAIKRFFILYCGLYIFLSFLVTGVFVHPVEQYLYIVNLIAILFLISAATGIFEERESRPRRWLAAAVVSVVIIALLALIAMNTHEVMPGSQVRFEIQGAD